MSFCGNCGKEIKDGIKYCPYCGNAMNKTSNTEQSNVGMNHQSYNDQIPYMVKKEQHTAAIVLGYIFTIFPPLLFGLIFGIYLVTRDNKDVHKHGIIMIVLSIIFGIIRFFILMSIMSSYRSHYYPRSYYYYY